MKLTNTTQWSDHFLRRMVSWCCKEIGLPVRSVKAAAFGKRSEGAFNGRAWGRSKRIRVVIGPEDEFPVKPFLYPGRKSDAFVSPRYDDQTEALVGVTAHELTHLLDNLDRRRGYGERKTRFNERKAVEAFRENREALLEEWSRATKPRPAKSIQDKRAEQAAKKLAEWQRKAKLAQTKVKKYRQQVAYYDRVAATRSK